MDSAATPASDSVPAAPAELFAGLAIEPRPYQHRICARAAALFEGTARDRLGRPEPRVQSVMIESPTGSGKTVMGLAIARWLQAHHGDRVGWVSMRRNLLAQAAEENRRRGFGVRLELISMFDRNPPPVDLLVVDEAQHDAAATMASLHGLLRPRRVLGLTATPFRADRIKLCFQRVLNDAGIHQLIQDGYLSPYAHYTLPEYTPEAVAGCYAREPARWGRALAFFRTLDECLRCHRALAAAGVRAAVVTARTDRERQLDDFAAGRVDVLINMVLLTEGFDSPALRTVFCRPSGRGPTIQMAGRVFRRCPDVPLKQVVQCARTAHPMVRTAAAVEQHLWTPAGWRALTPNPRILAISHRALAAAAGAQVELPRFLTRHRRTDASPTPRTDAMPETTFEYGITRVRDLRLRHAPADDLDADAPPDDAPAALTPPRSAGDVPHPIATAHSPGGSDDPLRADGASPSLALVRPRVRRGAVRSVGVGDDWARPTGRFWRSFFQRFGISDAVFRYFRHEEVFARVAERARDDRLRYCVAREAGGEATLLAVTSPAAPYVSHTAARALLELHRGADVAYHEGVLTSTHVPRSGEHEVRIGHEAFAHRYVMDIPVDGFGRPQIYLSLLRMLCVNGAVGYAPAFRSEVSLGRNAWHSVSRAMAGFDHGEGYAALRQRFASAQASWASLREVRRVQRALATLPEIPTPRRVAFLDDLRAVTGDLNGIYGLANPDALTAKRQRVLPARCRVYDLLNFVSEVATHHVEPATARALQGLVGELVSDEYDLEGTAEKVTDFDDFLVAGGPGPR